MEDQNKQLPGAMELLSELSIKGSLSSSFPLHIGQGLTWDPMITAPLVWVLRIAAFSESSAMSSIHLESQGAFLFGQSSCIYIFRGPLNSLLKHHPTQRNSPRMAPNADVSSHQKGTYGEPCVSELLHHKQIWEPVTASCLIATPGEV